MHKRILVALDGSANAEHALPAAVALAHVTHAAIDLVRVHEPSPTACVTRGRWDEMSRRHELEGLHATAARLVASGAASVDVALVDGSAPVAVLQAAAQRGADLVLVTDRGRTPSRGTCLGSVSTSIMRHAHVPVLVMRARDCPADFSHGPIFRNVLVAVDDPDADAEVLEEAAELGRLGGGCTLWHAVDGAVAPVYPCGYAASAPNLTGVTAVTGHDPATAMVRAIAANTFDLLAIPSRCGAPNLGVGSLAQRVASASRLPIFICPTSRMLSGISASAPRRFSLTTPSSSVPDERRVLELA